MTSRVDAAAAAARRRAEEAARRAAEERRQAAERARKAAAEQAKKAATEQAKRAAAAAAKKAAAARSATTKKLKSDEFSTGRAKALRVDELRGSIPRLKIEAAAKAVTKTASNPATQPATQPAKGAKPEARAAARDAADGFLDRVRGFGIFGSGPARPKSDAELQAERDAEEIKELAEDDPAEALDQLNELMKANDDPEYRAELVDETKDAIEDVAAALSSGDVDEAEVQEAVEDLAEAAALAGSESAEDLGRAFARGLEGGLGGFSDVGDLEVGKTPLARSFMQAMFETPGAGGLVAGMIEEAKSSENLALLVDVAKITESSTTIALEEFNAAKEDIDRLNGELAQLVQGFGADADPADLQEAVENFKERHEEEYERYEAAGAAMSNVIELAPTALEETDDLDLAVKLTAALAEAPRVAETEAGQEMIGRALEAQARGEPSFLDRLGDVAETIDDGAGLLADMSSLVTQGIAARATALVADGRIDEANELIEGLSDNARLFGVDPEDLEGIESALKDTLAGDPDAVKRLNDELSGGVDGGTPLLDPNGPAAQALKGLGLAIGVAGLPGQFGNLDDAQIEEQIKVLAETLDLTQEAGSLALQVFGKTDSLASLDKLFGRVGVGASAVIAVADTISAVRSLSEGEFGDAAVSGLNAASGVLLLIPGAQVAGVGLAIASFALNSFLANRRQEEAERASEGDALQFLKDRGLEDDFAQVLANLNDDKQNIGPFVDQVAEELGLTQDELFEKLNDASGDDREQLLRTFGELSAVGEFAGGDFPVFGPPVTAEDLEDFDFLSEDEREQLAAQVNQRREEIAEQVAERIEDHLD